MQLFKKKPSTIPNNTVFLENTLDNTVLVYNKDKIEFLVLSEHQDPLISDLYKDGW